jgi:predicted ferric reductase
MFRRGRRLFSIASILMILTSIAHTLGHFQPDPQTAEFANLKSTMQAYQVDMMGMKPSAYGILESLSLTLTIMLLMLGLQNLLVAAVDESGKMIRRFTLVNVVGVGALVALYWYYHIPPPLISFALVEIVFLLAVLIPDRKQA